MKLLKIFMMAALIFGLSACSGSTSYSPEKCKALVEKVKAHEQLTEDDYTEMIDQVGAIAREISDKKAATKDNAEAAKALADDPRTREMVGYLLGMAIYLEMNKNELTESNQKHLEEVSDQIKDLDLN